ncbi:hypothetical protein MF672_042100 [Actinomadura sp. ATCC 31491]|uniref:Uncharacterized protein n=1 Tax=Actinomadura luzonensis TaxID=2805427 RepID=A0ABT0G8A4_9ACTN|nr:hypothetical protein [Actinomadura luzonensis]MCK2220351.1 hypothetical protein [Actinomadura luzonensis]
MTIVVPPVRYRQISQTEASKRAEGSVRPGHEAGQRAVGDEHALGDVGRHQMPPRGLGHHGRGAPEHGPDPFRRGGGVDRREGETRLQHRRLARDEPDRTIGEHGRPAPPAGRRQAAQRRGEAVREIVQLPVGELFLTGRKRGPLWGRLQPTLVKLQNRC